MSSVCVITRAVLKEHTEPVLTSFYLEKDKLTEVHPHLEGRSLLGNIYVGKVKHMVKNIDAAFVEVCKAFPPSALCFPATSSTFSPIPT